MLMVNHLIGFGAAVESAPIVPISIYPEGTSSIDTDGNNTFSFTMAAAHEDASRQIVAVVYGASGSAGRSLSGLTIGGVTATIDYTTSSDGTVVGISAIGRVSIPTGTSFTVSGTFTLGVSSVVVNLFTVIGAKTALVGIISGVVSGNSLSSAIDVVNGGGVIAAARWNGTSLGTTTWSGLATKDYDFTITNTNNAASAAHEVMTASQNARPISATLSAGSGPTVGYGAISLQPL